MNKKMGQNTQELSFHTSANHRSRIAQAKENPILQSEVEVIASYEDSNTPMNSASTKYHLIGNKNQIQSTSFQSQIHQAFMVGQVLSNLIYKPQQIFTT